MRARLPDRLMLGLYVKPIEWGHPSVDTSALVQMKPGQLLIARTPLTRGTLRSHICTNSTPISLLRILVAACAEEYSIRFPSYMDKKSY